MADFVPSVFRDLGKAVDDLFQKKFKNTSARILTTKTKTADGLTITGEHKQDGKTVSTLKGKFADKWGNAEASINTEVKYDATVKLTKLSEGVTVKAAVNSTKDGLQGNVETDYKQANVAVTVTGAHVKESKVNKEGALGNRVGGALVVGFDGVSLGGEAVYNVNTSKVVDYNGAFQFVTAAKDFELTVKTADEFNKFSLFGLHKYNPTTNVAAQVNVSLANQTKVDAIIGFQQKYDANTLIQGKLTASDNTGVVAGVWERVLAPTTKLSLLTEFNAVDFAAASPKFGLGLTLGELADD